MEELTKIKQKAEELLEDVETLDDLEHVRVKLLGRKGALTIFLRSIKDMPLAERKKVGPDANKLKKVIEERVRRHRKELQDKQIQQKMERERIDVTRPGERVHSGALHPLTQIERRAEDIFTRLGFGVAEGPHIETEHYNFDALNIPAQHPARDMWDTFWLRSNQKEAPSTKHQITNKPQAPNFKSQTYLLRTHTSPVQVRYMEQNDPPLRIVVPGETFRYEAIDATHNIQFVQLEGLLVDKEVSIAHFRSIIGAFFDQFFNADVEVRLRPSYFPFVEPGFEVDVHYNGEWLEMMGAGMVHPNVYNHAGLDADKWQGFAFGMGIDRLAMVYYGIDDIRLLYENDIRFLKQF